MSDKQFKITIAFQITIALILIYGFFAGFATKADIENLGNRMDDRLDRIENQLDKQSTRIENLNQNYINHLQAHNKQPE